MPNIHNFFRSLILSVIRLLLVTLFTFYLQELRQEQRSIRRDEADNHTQFPSDADEESEIDD